MNNGPAESWSQDRGRRKCVFLQFEYLNMQKKMISMKNGQGGLVGGEGGGMRKEEMCCFRCLPTTRVQLRQLCFRMKLSAHAKKKYFWRCPVHVFVCPLLFCQKQRAITKLERCSHGERVTSKPTQNIVTRWEDGKWGRGVCSQISDGDARLNNEEKQECALPSLDSGESLRRTHLWFYRPQVKALFLRGRRELEKEQRQHLSQYKGRM